MNGVIESQRGEIYRAHQGDEQLRRDHQLLHEQVLNQNWDLREAHESSLNEMEEFKRFQGSTFDSNSRRKLIEDPDTILELTGKMQDLQNEVNCMNNSRFFSKMLNQYALDNPTFPVNQRYSHLFVILAGMLKRPGGMPSRYNVPPDTWDTDGISGNVFANPTASSSAPFPQESNIRISSVSEHTSPHVMSESQTPAQDPRCQSGPSASFVVTGANDSVENYADLFTVVLRNDDIQELEIRNGTKFCYQ